MKEKKKKKMKTSYKVITKKSKEGHFLEVDINIQKIYAMFKTIYPFYLKEWVLKKVEKCVANLHDKNERVIHIKNLKQALNHGLILKKDPRVITFNQKEWLKSSIEMNTEFKKQKMISKKTFSNW